MYQTGGEYGKMHYVHTMPKLINHVDVVIGLPNRAWERHAAWYKRMDAHRLFSYVKRQI